MARKISHTKRGTFYNGPTGRRKATDPLGVLFSAAGAIGKASKNSGKKKSSSSIDSNYYKVYSDNSNGSVSKTGCIAVFIFLLLFVLIFGFLIKKCYGSHSSKKHRRWQHHERYKPHNNILLGTFADPWNCMRYSDNSKKAC